MVETSPQPALVKDEDDWLDDDIGSNSKKGKIKKFDCVKHSDFSNKEISDNVVNEVTGLDEEMLIDGSSIKGL